jgi:HSP20 family protein
MPFKKEDFKDLAGLQEKMGRLLSESVRRIREIAEPDAEKAWAPAVDIYELPGAFVLLVEASGIPRDHIAVEVQGQALVIRGDRPVVDEVAGAGLYRSERHYGAFERSFNLPVNVDSDRIRARMADGVLTITVAKPYAETSSRVQVNIEE